MPETYLGPCQTFMMELFTKVVNGFYLLPFFTKRSIIDVSQGPWFGPVRSIGPKMFCKKSVLKNFAKLTGKQLCQVLFFNKVAGLRPPTLLKKRLWPRCFPVNFAKFLRAPFFIEHHRWLIPSSNTAIHVMSTKSSFHFGISQITS